MAREIEIVDHSNSMPVISEAFAPAVTRQLDRMAYIKILVTAADQVTQGMHSDASEAIVQIARDHEWKMGQLTTRTGPAADALVILCAVSLSTVLGIHQTARDQLVQQVCDAFTRLPDADWGLIARVREILR